MVYKDELSIAAWQCIHFVEGKELFQTKEDLAKDGFSILEVQGDVIETSEQLFIALAKEMKFPDYFGNNWDALEECLRDMSWLPSKGYLLFFYNAEHFWKNSNRVAGKFVESWLFSA